MAIPRTFRVLSCAKTSITTRASFPARSSELMGGKLVSNCMSTILPRTDTIVPTLAGAVESGMCFSDEASTAGRILVPNACLCTESAHPSEPGPLQLSSVSRQHPVDLFLCAQPVFEFFSQTRLTVLRSEVSSFTDHFLAPSWIGRGGTRHSVFCRSVHMKPLVAFVGAHSANEVELLHRPCSSS
jgi:hypothetical protein